MIHYLIDAHNIIHHDPNLRMLIRRSIDHARNSLIQLLHNYIERYSKYQFTLVFDGNSDDIYSTSSNVVILFSGKRKADKIIKEIIEAEHYINEIVVVSTDREIFNYARLHSCQALDSSEFLFNLQNLNSKFQNPAYTNKEYQKHSTQSTEHELNEWMELFGEENQSRENKQNKKEDLKLDFSPLNNISTKSNIVISEKDSKSKIKRKKNLEDIQEELSEEEIKDMLHIFKIGKR